MQVIYNLWPLIRYQQNCQKRSFWKVNFCYHALPALPVEPESLNLWKIICPSCIVYMDVGVFPEQGMLQSGDWKCSPEAGALVTSFIHRIFLNSVLQHLCIATARKFHRKHVAKKEWVEHKPRSPNVLRRFYASCGVFDSNCLLESRTRMTRTFKVLFIQNNNLILRNRC